MAKNYYYLVSSLSPLTLDTGRLPLSSKEFIEFCREELEPSDFYDFLKIYLFNDIRNAIHSDNESYSYIYPSYYTQEEFRENLRDTDSFLTFLSEYFFNKQTEKRINPSLMEIDEVVLLLYQNLEQIENDFVKDYYMFELDLQNITTRLSLRMNNLDDVNKIIPFGDKYEMIRKSSAADLGVSEAGGYIENLVEAYAEKDLIKIEKKIEEIRWNWLEDRVGYDQFGINNILSYAVRLQSVERWLSLTEEKGEAVLNNIIESIAGSISL